MCEASRDIKEEKLQSWRRGQPGPTWGASQRNWLCWWPRDWNQPGEAIKTIMEILCFSLLHMFRTAVGEEGRYSVQCEGAYLWHTGSTSPRWPGMWGGRSFWCCRGCCRSWCDGWGRRCPLPRSRLQCDTPSDSGYNASDALWTTNWTISVTAISTMFLLKSVDSNKISEKLRDKFQAVIFFVPLLARCRSLSRQQVEQLCWGQEKPPPEMLVVPGSFRTQSSW